MNFKQVDQQYLRDGSLRLLLEVETYQLMYLGYFLESFEGFCNYTTPKRKEPILQVDIAPDFIIETQRILALLKDWDLGNYQNKE